VLVYYKADMIISWKCNLFSPLGVQQRSLTHYILTMSQLGIGDGFHGSTRSAVQWVPIW